MYILYSQYCILFVCSISKIAYGSNVTSNSKCGYPGLPQYSELSSTKTIFEDDELVYYECSEIYEIRKWAKRCVRGFWTEVIPVSGHGQSIKCWEYSDFKYHQI